MAKIRGTSDGINSSGDLLESSNDNIIKSGDIGAVLIHVGGDICLGVAEVLNFHQGSSKINLSAINVDDLDEEGTKAVSVAIQMIELSPQTSVEGSDLEWWSTQKYIQIQDSKDKIFQKRNYVLRIPGKAFHLLAPTICYDANELDGTA